MTVLDICLCYSVSVTQDSPTQRSSATLSRVLYNFYGDKFANIFATLPSGPNLILGGCRQDFMKFSGTLAPSLTTFRNVLLMFSIGALRIFS